jgi:arylsulfatase
MEVYAAQIEAMDKGIGGILAALEQRGQLENTIVLFLADNGGCHEEIGYQSGWAQRLPLGPSAQERTRDGRPVRFGNTPLIEPGGEDTYCSYGVPWANLSNTPFRKYKHWVHEGGIATPFIVHWPAGIKARGELRHQPAQLPDVMATLLEVCGARYPESIGQRRILPHEGYSMVPTFGGATHGREALYWEHEGNCAIRRGRWKLVREFIQGSAEGSGFQPWELYDIEADRAELHDLAAQQPAIVAELAADWEQWARRCKVQPFDAILRQRQRGE